MKRIVSFSKPYDTEKNGIGSAICRMILLHQNQAVHFVFSTGIYLPRTIEKLVHKPYMGSMGYDVGYHAIKPQYEGQEARDNCDVIFGPCYSDGSALRADEWHKIFVEEGDEKIWSMLEEFWKEMFA